MGRYQSYILFRPDKDKRGNIPRSMRFKLQPKIRQGVKVKGHDLLEYYGHFSLILF
jgi:hypothetical protein